MYLCYIIDLECNKKIINRITSAIKYFIALVIQLIIYFIALQTNNVPEAGVLVQVQNHTNKSRRFCAHFQQTQNQ